MKIKNATVSLQAQTTIARETPLQTLVKLFSVAVFILLSSCEGRDAVPKVDFTIDLSQSSFAALNNFGGQLLYNNILIFEDGFGKYHALQGLCTYDNCDLQYEVSPNYVSCTCHSCRYDVDGNVTMSPTVSPLVKYETTLSYPYLRVYSLQ